MDFEQYQKGAIYPQQRLGKSRDKFFLQTAHKFFEEQIVAGKAERKKELVHENNQRSYPKIKADPEKYARVLENSKQINTKRRAHPGHSDIDWVLANWKKNRIYLNAKTGYSQTSIMSRTWGIHQLVWMEANHRFIPDGFEINHIDLDKSNNVIENLELVTHKQNIEHAIENGVRIGPKKRFTKEELRKKNSKHVRAYSKTPKGRILMAKAQERYYAKNPDYKKEYGRMYYAKNRELMIQKATARRLKNASKSV